MSFFDRRPATPRWPLAAWLLCASLTLSLVPAPSQARHPDLELDDLEDDDIDGMLQEELDADDLAACGLHDLKGAASVELLHEVVMCALGDSGDADDERGLDFDDLEDEMNEAGTTVSDVVWEALEVADGLASGRPAATTLRVAFRPVVSGEASRAGVDGGVPYAWGDKRIRPPNAMVGPVKQGLIAKIDAVRR